MKIVSFYTVSIVCLRRPFYSKNSFLGIIFAPFFRVPNFKMSNKLKRNGIKGGDAISRLFTWVKHLTIILIYSTQICAFLHIHLLMTHWWILWIFSRIVVFVNTYVHVVTKLSFVYSCLSQIFDHILTQTIYKRTLVMLLFRSKEISRQIPYS